MDKYGKQQFYINRDSSYELLIYKKYLKVQDEIDVVSENKTYIGQLIFYLQGCPALKSKLRNLKYAKKSLENLFVAYYTNCNSSGIKFQKKTEKTVTEVGLLTGLSLTSVTFKGNGPKAAYLENIDYKPSLNFSAGLFFDAILSRNQGKWSLYNELNFSSYKFNGSFDDYKNEFEYTIASTSIGYSYLKMNNMLRFKYPVGNLFLFVNAGISNGYALSEVNYRKEEQRFFSIVRVKEGKAINDTRKYEQGYILSLGTKLKRYSFEVRYEKANGMSVYRDITSSVTRYYFLVGYRF